MAAPTLTETLDTLYTTTWQLMRDEVVNQIFTATPLWAQLRNREKVRRESGGRWIGFGVEYAKNSTVKYITRGGTVSLNKDDIATTGKVDWKYLIGNLTRYWVDDQQNAGKSQLMNKIQIELSNLKNSLIDSLETSLFSDGSADSGAEIDGLQNIISTTTTYAGLSPTTYTWWKATSKASTGAAAVYLRSDMTNVFNTVQRIKTPSNKPTLIITDQTSYELFETEVLAPMQRIINQELHNLGFDRFEFKGAPVDWSPAASPSGVMYFLNTNYLQLIVDSKADFEMTEWKTVPNSLDRSAQIVSALNLVCTNRSQQGKLTGIAA